ncbi:hypothetical protein UA70_15105 [Raoultella planticola]|nr:hypothetical protein UA70_15105 [Raoultella planticola]
MVLTFSVPLNPDQDFSHSVHLVDKKSGKVDGAWELSPDLKALRLRHLEPKRELIVSVDPTLSALNAATFDNHFEKPLPPAILLRASVLPAAARCCRAKWLPGCRLWR